MKPVLILQHIDDGGPGLFTEFLERSRVPYEIRRPDRGDPLPTGNGLASIPAVSFCGGTQSANDPLPWIHQEIDLIRAADERGMPVIGHCLGGQLIARALGGTVRRDPLPEFGWQELTPARNPLADAWLDGMAGPLVAAQWHYDSFTLPPSAQPLLMGSHCPNQAFVSGRMLAMQFHVEATRETIRHWAVDLAHLVPRECKSVQGADEVLAQLDRNFPPSAMLADRLYSRWLENL